MRRSAPKADTSYHEVRRGTFTVSIVEAGNLAAVSEVSVRNEVEGTARIIFIAPEGSFVRKGDLLVELDSAQARDQVNQQHDTKLAVVAAREHIEADLHSEMRSLRDEISALKAMLAVSATASSTSRQTPSPDPTAKENP